MKEKIIEILEKREIVDEDTKISVIHPICYPDIASEICQEIDKLLKECWDAGAEYGGNWTEKNFDYFIQQHSK